MDSYKKFYTATFVWNRKMLSILYHDIYDENFVPGIVTYFFYALNITFASLIIYTMIYYDFFIRLNCILYLALSIQVSANFC